VSAPRFALADLSHLGSYAQIRAAAAGAIADFGHVSVEIGDVLSTFTDWNVSKVEMIMAAAARFRSAVGAWRVQLLGSGSAGKEARTAPVMTSTACRSVSP